MNSVLLLITIVCLAAQNILKKQYNIDSIKSMGNMLVFNCISSVSTFIFFVINSKGEFAWDTPTALYSTLFAISFAVTVIFVMLAIKYGSLALTSLIVSYSLIIPCLFGIIFLNEPISFTLISGIILLIISLFFININTGGIKKISPFWGMFVFFAFVGNGMCATIQKLHQTKYPSLYQNEFMIMAMILVTFICIIALLFTDKSKIVKSLKKDFIIGIPTGIANAIVNLFIMILTVSLPASVLFPVVSAGGIVVTFIISATIYKEKHSKMQLLGFITGVASIIILNL